MSRGFADGGVASDRGFQGTVAFMWRGDDRPTHDIPACAAFLDAFLLEAHELLAALAIEPEREVVELLGHGLWAVFSDNHTVVDANGVAYDLGSFRASAGFIAESINRRYRHRARAYDYLDFYMGTSLIGHRAELRSVYRWIFGRLKERDCRWIYSFPRIYLVSFGEGEQDDDPTEYDPSEAVRGELERAEDAARRRELAADLERAHEEDVRRARDRPLPSVVAAYRDVFGTLPEGWPHPDM